MIQYALSNIKQNLRFIQRKNGNPSPKSNNLNYLIYTLEPNIHTTQKRLEQGYMKC